MNRALLQLAWGAEQPSFLSPVPPTDVAWASYAQQRIEVYSRRVDSMSRVVAAFPPAGRAPTSLDVIGAPTMEDSVRADMDRRDLWRLALDVRDTRGPITPGLMCLLLWAAHDGTPEGMPRLRPLEIRALRAWESVASPVPWVVAVLAVGVVPDTPLAALRALALAALDEVGAETWAAVECEMYDAAVASGLVPRAWRRNPIPTRLVTPEQP